MKPIDFLVDGPQNTNRKVIIAHGAGAPMDSPFMSAFANGLGARGIAVVRFEFNYMRNFRRDGVRRPPSRLDVLQEEWRAVLNMFGSQKLIIGGKSMGGRIASMLLSDLGLIRSRVIGLVCLGYPFHSPRNPKKTRVDHLRSIKTPTLICQGERDILGNKEEINGYGLPKSISIHWLPDGDHSFKPRKASGLDQNRNLKSAINAIQKFVYELEV